MEETIAAQVASKEGEVVGQFSCIFETITTKIWKSLKFLTLFDYLNF